MDLRSSISGHISSWFGYLFCIFYELGDPNAEKWELEDPQTGEFYASEDYYNDGLTIVEFFNSKMWRMPKPSTNFE